MMQTADFYFCELLKVSTVLDIGLLHDRSHQSQCFQQNSGVLKRDLELEKLPL